MFLLKLEKLIRRNFKINKFAVSLHNLRKNVYSVLASSVLTYNFV